MSVIGGQILGFSFDSRCRSYKTLALPCECVIIHKPTKHVECRWIPAVASDPARASATVNQPTVSTAAAAAAMDLGASADNNDNDNGDSGDITVIYHDASTTSSSVVA